MLSKTHLACDCLFLQQALENDDLPIGFDKTVNEFFFAYPAPGGGQGRLRLRHCPWCGGKASESTRGRLFADIPEAESARLFALTEPLKTRDDVLAALGEPDEDNTEGLIVETPAKDGRPRASETFQTLIYTRLSDTADVVLQVAAPPAERIEVVLYGKYIGSPPNQISADPAPSTPPGTGSEDQPFHERSG